jgi:hypothetical protein
VRTDLAPAAGVGVFRPAVGTRVDATQEQEAALLRAMVVDPDEAGRIIATSALMAFEPGFDVVSVANVDAAGEWLENFVPDLLVVSAALESSVANQLVATVLAAPGGNTCRLISIGNVGDEDALAVHGRHASLRAGVDLSHWLHAVHQVFRQEDLSSFQPA